MLHTTVYIHNVYSGVTKPIYALGTMKALIISGSRSIQNIILSYSQSSIQKDNCRCYGESTLPKKVLPDNQRTRNNSDS